MCSHEHGRVVLKYANEVSYPDDIQHENRLTVHSGGLYYAAAVLAPPGWGPLAAWLTGWSNWIVQITGAPSVDYALAAMILAAASITHPGYEATNYQTFLLTVFIMIIHAFISSMPTLWIARFNSFGTTINLIALFIVIVMIPSCVTSTPKFRPSHEVWGTITNGTEFPDGVAVLMSFLGILWTMSGYDAPFHLSEECSNASIAAPRAIVLTSASGGILGWFLQLIVAYTVLDITSVIDDDLGLGQPWAGYLIQVLPKKAALAILSLTIVCGFSMGQGCMVAASRVTFAYARDDCFPFSSWIKKVNKTTGTPVNAVWFSTVIGCALLLLIFGGSVAIGAIFSVGAIAAYVAFTIPIFIKVFFVGDRFRRGPWHLGKFSRSIGMMSCAFVLVMMPFFCFPSVKGSDLNAELMNWTVVVYGGPMLFVIIWWFISAHKWFKGPHINVEHHMLGRIDGIEAEDEHFTGTPSTLKGKEATANLQATEGYA